MGKRSKQDSRNDDLKQMSNGDKIQNSGHSINKDGNITHTCGSLQEPSHNFNNLNSSLNSKSSMYMNSL